MSPKIATALLLAGAALLPGPWCVSAWAQGDTGFTRGKGHADVVFSYGVDDYAEEPLFPGNELDVRRRTYSTYAAVGLTDDLDLVLTAAYADVQVTRFAPDVSIPFERKRDDWQDASVGLKWRLGTTEAWGGRVSFVAAPAVKFALTDYNEGISSGGTLGERLSLGAEQTDWRTRFITHYQSERGIFWASLETGYDFREKEPADEVPINLILGFSVFDYRLTLMPFYSRVVSTDEATVIQGAVSAAGVDVERYGLHVYGALGERFGLVANVHVSDDGRETGSIPGFSVGLVVRF